MTDLIPPQARRETPEILRQARAQVVLMEHAERAGLPLPFTGSVEHWDHRPITFFFAGLDDLAAWSLYLEAPIAEEPNNGAIHHHVRGELLEERVDLIVVTGGMSAQASA